MSHPQQHIIDLCEILYRRGISRVVISPGSRNAPLIKAFVERFGDACISIVDERSAAYVALGIARQSQLPAVLLCTSGTAVLNYAPPLAEAYYQQIPLIAITADRPAAWIDQQDNQTIRQKNIYQNYIKAAWQLEEVYPSADALSILHETIHNAYTTAISEAFGPVHINVPLAEPLYLDQPPASAGCSDLWDDSLPKGDEHTRQLLEEWESAKRIMIVHGQEPANAELQKFVDKLCSDNRLVFIAENTSNLHPKKCIANPELLLARIENGALPPPDLLLYAGGQVVSKKLKHYLRETKIASTWRIGRDAYPMDTFQKNNTYFKRSALESYGILSRHVSKDRTLDPYQKEWLAAQEAVSKLSMELFPEQPFSDSLVVNTLMQKIPSGAVADLGNSSIIRLSQLSNKRKDLSYHSNRGVSGIDGCLSSAVGGAMVTDKLTVSIIGDLSFLYDSNALWNRYIPKNFRLVILNNQGGGIFGLIPGSASSPVFEEFLKAHHPVNIQKLVEAYNLKYFCASDPDQLEQCLPEFWKAHTSASVLEIHTRQELNRKSFNALMGGDK